MHKMHEHAGLSSSKHLIVFAISILSHECEFLELFLQGGDALFVGNCAVLENLAAAVFGLKKAKKDND